MFIRKKKNKSGSISIQIIKKKNGKSKLVETIGCAKNDNELNLYLELANKRLKELEPTLFDFVKQKDSFISLKNNEISVIGDELIFGKLIEDLKCNEIFRNLYKSKEKAKLFKALIVSRILYQGSKLYLSDYLFHFKKESISEETIYRLLDKIYEDEIKLSIEKCVFKHTLKLLNNKLLVSFYDVTTLHFESESEDDLRRVGFSKEGRLNRPQIQLGLFTTLNGHPLSYEVFEGNRYEGNTLIDVLINFQKKFNIKEKPIVVADRGMLNKSNIATLENNGYKYILGARIKNISNNLKQQISNLVFISDEVTHQIEIDKTIKYKDDKNVEKTLNIKQRVILSHSIKRAKKDKYLREKALDRLKSKIEKSSNITKSDLKVSPYAKFLDVDENCTIKFKLDENKIKEDENFDGIKGFFTNDFSLPHNDIIKHYQNLWHIEKAFRISKTDLQIRPIYHRLEKRIKAHILISFVSYTIYKEFERRLEKSNININRKILLDMIKSYFALNLNGELHKLQFTEQQKQIYDAIYSN